MQPTRQTLEAWRLLLEAHRLLAGRLDQELRERHGLRLSWYDVLVQLHEAGGRLRMHALADATLFSRADATRTVDRMERADLVRREPDPEDRRGVYAALTATGKTELRRAAVTHLDGIERHFGSRLGRDDVAALTAALRAVVAEAS